MISTRLKMSEEGLLWKTALEYFGPTGLHEVVVEKWMTARPCAYTTYLAQLRMPHRAHTYCGLR